MSEIADAKDINIHERFEQLMARRELSKPKRIQSMRNRLHVKLGNFKSYYEDI